MDKVTILHVNGEVSKLHMNKETMERFLQWLEDSNGKEFFNWQSYYKYFIFRQGIAKIVIE